MVVNREKLLREYVRQILNEDFGGGDFGGGGGMGMGFGGGYVDPSDMYTVFIKPFTDVYDTIQGKTKETSVAALRVLRVSLETALTTIIPILSSDYDKIFKKYDDRMDKVREEYKDIYDSTWTAFTDNDVVLAAFAMYPTMMITQITARKAPIPIIHTLDALTGGFFEKYFERMIKTLSPDDAKPLEDGGGSSGDPMHMGGYGYGGGGYGGFDGGGFGEGVIYEKKAPSPKKKKKSGIADKIMHPKIIAAVKRNPRVREMMNDSRTGFREVLEELFDKITKVAGARDLTQLQAVLGKQIPGMDEFSKLPPEQQQKASKKVMHDIRKAMIAMYTKNLTEQAKRSLAAGVPKEHPMIRDLMDAVKRIKSL